MKLYLSEKPSLAKTIAEYFGEYEKKHGYFLLFNGDVITWCFGHMYENFNTEDYNKKNLKWEMNDLPIIPNEFKLKPKESSITQLNIINDLIKKSNTIINCGDPDREGQLLIDEVIEESNFSKEVKRAWLKDLSLKGLKHSFENLENNIKYKPLSDSAKARSHLDWLTGINLTRVYTLHANSRGHNFVLSVGRVQTPTTYLVVKRDNEILNFKPIDYYEIKGKFQFENHDFFCKYKSYDKCLDRNNDKCINKNQIENEINRLNDFNNFTVNEITCKEKLEKPPLPFSLSTLQTLCNKKHGLSAQEVLNIAQSLYSEHKITTYPRSDCNYLNENSYEDSKEILLKLKPFCDFDYIEDLNLNIIPACFDDNKISAHTAIIPNGNIIANDKLSQNELIVYKEIILRFLLQFFDSYKYTETNLQLVNGNDLFTVSGKVEILKGFYKILKPQKKSIDYLLPSNLKKGDIVKHLHSDIVIKKTTPPKPYNEGTLISTMNNISKSIEDKNNKIILKEVGGIGTEATRSTIIENLKERGYLEVKNNSIVSTERAKNFIKIILDEIKYPTLTAEWENKLKSIENGKMTYDDFMCEQIPWVTHIVKQAKQSNIDILGGIKCPKCNIGYLKSIKTKKINFLGCILFPKCDFKQYPHKKTKKFKKKKR